MTDKIFAIDYIMDTGWGASNIPHVVLNRLPEFRHTKMILHGKPFLTAEEDGFASMISLGYEDADGNIGKRPAIGCVAMKDGSFHDITLADTPIGNCAFAARALGLRLKTIRVGTPEIFAFEGEAWKMIMIEEDRLKRLKAGVPITPTLHDYWGNIGSRYKNFVVADDSTL